MRLVVPLIVDCSGLVVDYFNSAARPVASARRAVAQKITVTTLDSNVLGGLSGIDPGYSCKEGRIVEDGLLLEFPYTPTRTRSVCSY
jgi:hypothetical protein